MSFEGFSKDAGVDSQESCGSLDIRGRWAHGYCGHCHPVKEIDPKQVSRYRAGPELVGG